MPGHALGPRFQRPGNEVDLLQLKVFHDSDKGCIHEVWVFLRRIFVLDGLTRSLPEEQQQYPII